jgi:hypothetical protein
MVSCHYFSSSLVERDNKMEERLREYSGALGSFSYRSLRVGGVPPGLSRELLDQFTMFDFIEWHELWRSTTFPSASRKSCVPFGGILIPNGEAMLAEQFQIAAARARTNASLDETARLTLVLPFVLAL